MINITRYEPSYKASWDEIIANADNGHFMLQRDFMDYHADRFHDCSFIVLQDDTIIGAIPGNLHDNKWYSHQGLSFGGLFLKPKCNRILIVNQIFTELFQCLQNLHVSTVIYKFIPHIYHQRPCDADLYSLSKYKAIKEICEVSSSINLSRRTKFSEIRIRGKKKSDKSGVVYALSNDWAGFWQVLTARLMDKYEKNPVHSLDEIVRLSNSFPNNIFLFTATHDAEGICAGVVVFVTETVAHCQYISANDFGLSVCALDGLFDFLISYFADLGKNYFNFGISTENAGTILNENLIQFKEGFGAQSMVHTTRHYELSERVAS